MKIETKDIPEGIRYLSDWEGFDELPHGEHYILAKEICDAAFAISTPPFWQSLHLLTAYMPLHPQISDHTY